MSAWPGWSPEDTLVLPIEDTPPSRAVLIDQRRFEPKHELHITLVGKRLGAELRSTLGERLDAATRPAFEALDWTFQRRGEAALIQRRVDRSEDGAATVIEFVELPAMPHFHRWLGELLGRQLPVPPAHVTLYTHAKAKGIGIPTPRALKSMLRRRLDLAALRPA